MTHETPGDSHSIKKTPAVILSFLTPRRLQAYRDAGMRRLSFFIPDELEAALKALKERDGVAEAESIRRALALYLKEKGVLTEAKSAKGKR